jgi:hypothetical protein
VIADELIARGISFYALSVVLLESPIPLVIGVMFSWLVPVQHSSEY